MPLKLVCVQPYTGFAKGNEVTDAGQIASIWATRPVYFVQVIAGSAPPPTVRTWTDRSALGSGVWSAIALSQNGAIVVAGSQGGGGANLNLSNDAGGTFAPLSGSGSQAWLNAAMSSDGSVFGAVPESNAFGPTVSRSGTWTTPNIGTTFDGLIAISGDGRRVAISGRNLAGGNGAPSVYLSIDGGDFVQIFTGSGVSNNTQIPFLAMSRDGSAIVFGWQSDVGDDLTLITGDGATVTSIAPVHGASWCGIALSADGNTIYAVDFNTTNVVFKSTNRGVGWVQKASPVPLQLGVCSDDGQVLAAVDADLGSNVLIYVSENGADDWASQTPPGRGAWTNIAVSGDGSTIVAGGNTGDLWTSP